MFTFIAELEAGALQRVAKIGAQLADRLLEADHALVHQHVCKAQSCGRA